MKEVILLNSEEESKALARKLAKKALPGSVFAFYGDLGSGKTFITKEIARALQISDDITSPTFTLLEEYKSGSLPLYHFDLYRLECEEELDNLAFDEYWEGNGLSVIEWAENAGDRLPERKISISIEYIDSTSRRATIEYPDI